MLPLPYTNAAAAALFVAACLVWIIPEAMGMRRQTAQISRQGAHRADRGSLVLLIGLQWVGLGLNFGLAATLPGAAILWHRTALFAAALVLILLGVAWRWYAIWTLGHSFTRDVAVSIDQELIHHGPYRWIRHPAYSGTFLTMLGVGLAMTNWASLAFLLLGVGAGHLYRVHVEEEALRRWLGEPYIDYSRRTKRFIPLIF